MSIVDPKNGAPVVAVDIGGTKMASAVVTPDGSVHARHHVATRGTDAHDVWRVLHELISATLATWNTGGGASPTLMGVGCGGPMDAHADTVSPLNIPQWQDFPLRARLAERFALPTALDNDAKALALAEGWRGAAQAETNYLAMVVSTGVGAGIVVDGHLLDGATGNAGHLGHVIVEPDGRPCRCGSRGCLEAEASGTAIAAITGRDAIDAPTMMRQRVGTLVGRGVAAAVVLGDLRLACVGGSVALGYGPVFFNAANAELERLATIGYATGAKIVPVGLGADAPLVGAACVAYRYAADVDTAGATSGQGRLRSTESATSNNNASR